MTQPNFLQVQTSLDRACAFVEAHPDLSSSARYGAALAAMRDRFVESTRSTDASYSRWRNALGEERSRYRDVKHVLDDIAALADEHGYDDAPRARIIYTDTEQLRPLAEQTRQWLGDHSDDWTWVSEQAARLQNVLAESADLAAQATRLYQQYTVAVKRRVTAYDDAVALVREYFVDAKREGERFDDFARVKLDVL